MCDKYDLKLIVLTHTHFDHAENAAELSRKNCDLSFIAGRIAMTCCSEDLTVFGFICDAEGEHELASEEWVDICCVMQKEYSEKFELWHLVCKVSSIVPSKEPGKRIIRVT